MVTARHTSAPDGANKKNSAQAGCPLHVGINGCLHRFPEGGVVLRASGIYGDRDVGPVTVPLGALMRPMEMVSPRGESLALDSIVAQWV